MLELCFLINAFMHNSQWLLKVLLFIESKQKTTQPKNISVKTQHLFCITKQMSNTLIRMNWVTFPEQLLQLFSSKFHWKFCSENKAGIIFLAQPEDEHWCLVSVQQLLRRCVVVGYLILARILKDKDLVNLLFLYLFQRIKNSPEVFIKFLMIHCIQLLCSIPYFLHGSLCVNIVTFD